MRLGLSEDTSGWWTYVRLHALYERHEENVHEQCDCEHAEKDGQGSACPEKGGQCFLCSKTMTGMRWG